MKLKSSIIANKKKTALNRKESKSSAGKHSSKLPPVPPGKILKEQLMEPYGLNTNKLSAMLGVSPTRMGEIIRGDRIITVDSAARLGRCFGTSAQFWLNLQVRYELEKAEDAHLIERINKVVKVFRTANAC